MSKLDKAISSTLIIWDKIESTDDLVKLNDVAREYTLSRLKQKEQELISQQTELQNKIEKLNNN